MYRYLGTLRMLLATMVVAYHLGTLLPGGARSEFQHLEIGFNAVLVFFAISGYVIAGAYANFYHERPFAFMTNRCLRLIPTYLIALAIFILVTYLAEGTLAIQNPETQIAYSNGLTFQNILANAFLIVPFSNAVFGVDGEPFLSIAWAVRVEFLFYAVFFSLCLAAHYLRWHWERVLTLAFWPVVALFAVQQFIAPTTQLQYIPYFAFGVALQMLEARLSTSQRNGAHAGTWQGPALACVTCLLLIGWHHLSRAPYGPGYERYLHQQYVELMLLLTVFVALVWLSHTDQGRLRKFASLDKALGDLTYPLYLNHAIVVLTLMAIFGPSIFASVGGVLAAILFAVLVSALTEPYIARLRDRVRGRRVSAPTSAAFMQSSGPRVAMADALGSSKVMGN
jgi:peptidoglycan/LPS O-acetylase OafA/YrhL